MNYTQTWAIPVRVFSDRRTGKQVVWWMELDRQWRWKQIENPFMLAVCSLLIWRPISRHTHTHTACRTERLISGAAATTSQPPSVKCQTRREIFFFFFSLSHFCGVSAWFSEYIIDVTWIQHNTGLHLCSQNLNVPEQDTYVYIHDMYTHPIWVCQLNSSPEKENDLCRYLFTLMPFQTCLAFFLQSVEHKRRREAEWQPTSTFIVWKKDWDCQSLTFFLTSPFVPHRRKQVIQNFDDVNRVNDRIIWVNYPECVVILFSLAF